jgi:hypothetical protein
LTFGPDRVGNLSVLCFLRNFPAAMPAIPMKITPFLSRILRYCQEWRGFSESGTKWHGNEDTSPHQGSRVGQPPFKR